MALSVASYPMWETRRTLKARIEELEGALRDYGERILELERGLSDRDQVLRAHGIEARSLADVIAASSAGIPRRRDQRALKGYISAAGALVGYGAWFVAGAFGGLEAGDLTEQLHERLREEHIEIFECVDRVQRLSNVALDSLAAWESAERAQRVEPVELQGDGYELSATAASSRFDVRPGPDPTRWRVTASAGGMQTEVFEITAFEGPAALADAIAFLEREVDEPGALAVPDRGSGPVPTRAVLLRRDRLSPSGV